MIECYVGGDKANKQKAECKAQNIQSKITFQKIKSILKSIITTTTNNNHLLIQLHVCSIERPTLYHKT